MKKNSLYIFATLFIAAFAFRFAAAQFPIKIPKLPKVEKPKTEQPKSDGNSSIPQTQQTTKTGSQIEFLNRLEPTNKTAEPTAKTGANPKVEKADFTVTAEELHQEFIKKGAKEEDLKKYASKYIAVSGRVSMLVMEKTGTTQPWVTLYAPGVLGGVSCYFDDDNLEQMKQLKMDKMVKVQGFKDGFIVPEVKPTLDHCVVIEAN